MQLTPFNFWKNFKGCLMNTTFKALMMVVVMLVTSMIASLASVFIFQSRFDLQRIH